MPTMKKSQALISDATDLESGIVNPAMGADLEMTDVASRPPTQVTEETEVESFMLNLTARRRRKQKELSQTTPESLERLSDEVRSVKQRSRKALNENSRSSLSSQPLSTSYSATSSVSASSKNLTDDSEKEGVVKQNADGKPVPRPRDGSKQKQKMRIEAGANEEETNATDRSLQKKNSEELSKTTDSESDEVDKRHSKNGAPGDDDEKDEDEDEEQEEAEEDDGDEAMDMVLSRSTIRDKIKSLREKAKMAAASEVQQEEQQERMSKIRHFEPQFKSNLEKEERELERRTKEATDKLFQRWKRQKSSAVAQKQSEITAKQGYDFFTQTWEGSSMLSTESPSVQSADAAKPTTPDDNGGNKGKIRDAAGIVVPGERRRSSAGSRGKAEGKTKKEKGKGKEGGSRRVSKDSTKAEEEGEDEIDNGYYEDTYPLLGNISEKDGCSYYHMTKAQKICYTSQVKSEAEIYYYPSSSSIPPAEKLSGSQKEARNLVDEGFYVGSPPSVATSNRNRMEHRLIQGKHVDKKWFGEDGEIITLPDPLKLTPSRPPVPEEEDSNFGVVYTKAEVREFDTRLMSGCADNDRHYQLDIDINSIVFSQHHLFSMEHVLANKLLALYQQYSKIMKKNSLSFLTKKLKAVKTSTLHLQNYLQSKEDLSEEDKANYRQRLNDYKTEIRQIRNQRDHEEQCCHRLVKAIIQTWKNIKHLREKQQFVATSIKLTICKQEMDRDQDDQQWRQEIEEELEEAREEYEESYQQKLIEYQQELEEWQKKQQLRKEAVKRRNMKAKKKKKSRTEDDEEEEEEDEQTVKDEEILAEETTSKPVCPEAFDERGTRESIRSKALECRRHPGTPKLSPEITYTANVTPAADCPRIEQRRRNDVSSCRLFIKVLFNDKQVLQTNQRFLLEDFRVNFGQIYHLKIVQWPESIKLQIYEARTLSSTLLSQLYLAIPETSVTTDNITIEQHDFSSDISIQFTHNAVGSGVAINVDPLSSESTYINTTGSVLCSVAWAIGDDGLPMAPSPQTSLLTKLQCLSHKLDPLAAIGASGIMDLEKLSKWVRTARLDPNDPNNADLMFLLRPHIDDKSQLREQTFFRLEPFQEEFNFATDEEILQSSRFRLLRLRQHEVREFCNYSMVPALDKEIPKSVFKEYELRKKEEEKLQFQEDIETQRAFVGRYKDKLHEEMLSRFRVAVHRKRQEEIVIEEASPSINMIGKSLLNLLQPRRPLKPVRKERKRVSQGVKGDEVHILINVIQAFNIPVRQTSAITSETSMDSQFQSTIEESVRPFIEISFQKFTVRTHCADGPNPSFNEELLIPFRTSNHNLTPKNLQTVTDVIHLTIFDEVHVNILQDDTKQDTEIHQRVEKKWLGTLKIPFSTIYYNGKIEGTLQLNTPPLLLGYCQPKNHPTDMDSILMPLTDSYITLFITLQPTLIPPEPFKERFDSNEDEKLLQYCDVWQRQLEAKWSKRVYKTTVTDILGKAVFVTRFFKPLLPPKEITTGKTGIAAAQAVAKYVSLIPHVPECRALPECCDIWTTCDQFLQMLAGDSDEHSILLTNYFLGLGKTAYFGLGSGIPNGVTSCVLTMEENGSCLLWNYKDGRFYYTYTSYLPLHNLGCLINNKNIWANVQMYDNPTRMTFNIDDASCWKPFFHSNYPNPGLSSVQVDSLDYTDTDDSYVKELQDKIEKCLKNKFSDWRRKHLTRWNRYFTMIIRKILPKLEENCTSATIKEHITDIEHSWSSYKISGSPINMSFTDIPSVVQSIYEMGIHSYDTSNVEFALAVYVHPYPNNILSVWVYVTALVKMR
ncbi:coiled-coil and C2 domain-containing protein 2A isoform X1 [Octopus bimaculoides]|uniref:coiled-coil and C2 domain-containing protein 2A isoform X1 n=1 Tax=Octopus bimaculoides TaxID=37653 RepID=UPI00071D31E2|nr:coiled-coil and C2 domain-containing protein 2A isoform X1 [Octopus bimaculoides]XP_014781200.1 coiled-coil and C2 domain-containing protein 2A isoform X1 [Octopus bimaculoides]XP_052831331.1 coiled-coil and C2 domain-containing protein 2A isoform X1 [Octopus bimaculoides]|eukprot:XP_014781199.1 PREDICTED: coiled-coil and C2 domain-containing protein 2A-like isoform X1 [Octopus bimaculoides]